MKDYRYILLDNDGTLMDFITAQAKAFENTWNLMPQSAIIPFSPYLLDIYDKCNKRWWAKLEKKECTKAELVVERFLDLFEELGLVGDGDEMNRIYGAELSKRQDMYPGAVEGVKALSEKYKVYITTNGVTTTQHSRLDNCAFSPYFTKMYVSEETGFAKPDKRYFDYVMSDIGDTDPGHYLIIGDSLSSDILGAYNSGIDSIWVNTDRISGRPELGYMYEAENFTDAVRYLTEET